jgi:hypothetical protein
VPQRGRFIAACIGEAKRALNEQKIAGEIIVADNGSTDGSPDNGDQEIIRWRTKIPSRQKMDSKTASKLQEGAPQSEREKRPDVRDFTNIPTEDSRAALQFCQSLARMLAASSNPAINNSRQLQIVGGIKAAPSTPEHQRELSVVIPVFNEEGNITVLYSRLTAVLEDTHID